MYAHIAVLCALSAYSVVMTHSGASGKLARNGIVGIRIPSTMASDAAWRAGHRAAIPIARLTVPVALAGSAGVAMTDPGSGDIFFWSTGALIMILIAGVVVAGKTARGVGRG